MFTGLIEQVGTIGGWQRAGALRRLIVCHAPWSGGGLSEGDSVAVNGACLTAESVAANHFVCAVLEETVRRTSLAEKPDGARVNLERAMAAGARFGGHMVQGHVDGIGRLRDIRTHGGDRIVAVACPKELMPGVVAKGSVAVDGISLTVAGTGADGFDVHVIPHTWEHTALGSLKPGRAINIETDIIGKYVERHLAALDRPLLTEEKLRSAGNWLI